MDQARLKRLQAGRDKNPADMVAFWAGCVVIDFEMGYEREAIETDIERLARALLYRGEAADDDC